RRANVVLIASDGDAGHGQRLGAGVDDRELSDPSALSAGFARGGREDERPPATARQRQHDAATREGVRGARRSGDAQTGEKQRAEPGRDERRGAARSLTGPRGSRRFQGTGHSACTSTASANVPTSNHAIFASDPPTSGSSPRLTRTVRAASAFAGAPTTCVSNLTSVHARAWTRTVTDPAMESTTHRSNAMSSVA